MFFTCWLRSGFSNFMNIDSDSSQGRENTTSDSGVEPQETPKFHFKIPSQSRHRELFVNLLTSYVNQFTISLKKKLWLKKRRKMTKRKSDSAKRRK